MSEPVDWQQRADELAAGAVAAGRPTAWFEQLYAEGVTGAATLAWDRAAPNPLLVLWAADNDAQGKAQGGGRRAVVVGAGLGADAAYLAELGYATTAFDVSPTAVGIAAQRAPSVDFVTADLLDLPPEWHQSFDLVVEIYTVQALPRGLRSQAAAYVADLVADSGTLVAIQALLGPEDDPEPGPPWPFTRPEMDAFSATGLDVVRIDSVANSGGSTASHWLAELTRR
jgi:SAM-dependent methyltransferase